VAASLATNQAFIAAVAAAIGQPVTTPPGGGGTTPPAGGSGGTPFPNGTGPSGTQFMFYYDGVTQSPGDYNYSGVTANYGAAPAAVDPLFPLETKVVGLAGMGGSGGFQPRFPGDTLDVTPYNYLWLRVYSGTGNDTWYLGGEAPGDQPFFINSGLAIVNSYLTAPQVKGWNWLKVPFRQINGGIHPNTAWYKYTLAMTGETTMQVGAQVFSAQ
jgi:hypothetical protein